jgi:hypothetical protein
MYVEAICPVCLASHVVPEDMRGEKYRCDRCEEVFIVNRKSKRTSKRRTRSRPVRPADELGEVLPLATEAPAARKRGGRPKKRGRPVGLIIGLTGGALLFAVLCGLAVWWTVSGKGDATTRTVNSVPQDDRPQQARGRHQNDGASRKDDPAKPKTTPPKAEPPKPVAAVGWKVKVDPPARVAKLPADFTKEVTVPATNTEVVFPTATGSPFVAVGDNFDDKDERQVWDLQTNTMTGKLVGRRFSAGAVLSPDGAHLALMPLKERDLVDVVALASGKSVRIDTGIPADVVDFAGPGKLLVAGKQGAAIRLRVWDATTGKRERDFDGPLLGTTALARDMVAVSPGGAYLAVVTPDDLWLWDMKTGTAAGRRSLPWNARNWLLPCRGLSFSPDGSELAGLFQIDDKSRLVSWDVARGESVFDVTFPPLQLGVGTPTAYKGHVLGWVGDRRGWLLYGQMFIDRKADRVAPAPAALLVADQPFRRMVGPDHMATLPGGIGGHKVLTVSRFDPDTLK